MRLDDDTLRFSPTDLAAFSACGHRTVLDRLRAHGRASAPRFDDPLLDLLKKKGIEHEERFLDTLRAEGKRVVAFEPLAREERTPGGYRRRAAETRGAMAHGADVIYQGTLYDGTWLGLVDFLLKVDRPSDLGPWSYEVLDAKLAREAKAMAVLQCCVYSDLLEPVQGLAPERIHLYLGGPRPRQESFRLAHFAAYYRAMKARLLRHVAAAPDTPAVAPDPVEFCGVCDWKTRCGDERRAVDHLSLVAGIARDHRRALETLGVSTLEALAGLPLEPTPEGLRTTGFQRIREQARVQLEGRRRQAHYHERLPPSSDEGGRPLGLGALPKPSEHDWFFDLESASLAGDDGLEYLWGVTDARDGYTEDWAWTPAEEKRALEAFLTRALAHVEAHPDAHIYHFGHKETSTLKRLVGRYAVGTDALDTLLQRQVFVDLHRVVKQGIVAAVERYSLKPLEALAGYERDVPLPEANRARGVLEAGLAQGVDPRELTPEELAEGDLPDVVPIVRGYNRDDCVATRVLRDWLERERAALEAELGEGLPRPVPPVEESAGDDAAEVASEVQRLMEGLLAGLDGEPEDLAPDDRARWLLAHLLEWHRREDKTAWWDYFRMRELSTDELVEESRPLGGLEYVGPVEQVRRSTVYRYRFPPQEHRMEEADKGLDPDTEKKKARTIHAFDEAAGTVDLIAGNRTPAEEMEGIRALLPDDIVGTGQQKARLRETASRLLESKDALGAWSPSSWGLLRGEAPRFADGHALPADHTADLDFVSEATAAALALDRSVLPIQGPPGTGKTYCGARMIRALLRAGRRVGVTAMSHKVITNLLDAVCEADREDAPTRVVGLQVTKSDGCTDARFTKVEKSGHVDDAVPAGVDPDDPDALRGAEAFNLIAGTAWLWCSDRMHASVDVLFIDEAGQFSLANALAVAPAAESVVLLGDPQQLNQPQKGIHPPGAEASALEHLAGPDGILAPDRGLFLGKTWRMRPEITAFTSELFYDGELRYEPDNARQGLSVSGLGEVHGLFHVPVQHRGNGRESAEEAEAVVGLFRTVLSAGAIFTDRKGRSRFLTVGDLLVLAPYNAQVSRIRAALSESGLHGARVGTVDKFQGQEAPVAIYSLASSSAEDAPRGMAFLYALDRLNVATSRARCATIVVSSPRVLEAEGGTPEQMRRVNAFVRYGEMGTTMQDAR